MSSAYDQQIKKLVAHIQTLNQALHERNMQIAHWQQAARAVQDERSRLARGLMDQVKQALSAFNTRFQGLKEENKKLRVYIDHQRQLHEAMARDLQGQLQYALTRIEELAKERSSWRQEVAASRQAAVKYQQQVQEQKGVLASQQAAVSELSAQLEAVGGFADREEALRAELQAREAAVEAAQARLTELERERDAQARARSQLEEAFASFKVRANEETAALTAEIARHREAQTNVDDRVEDMTALLANSEREVAKLFKELGEERALRKELEIRFEAASKDLTSHKRKVTRLEKERESAKGARITDLQKELTEMRKSYEKLQDELTNALADKTKYMQALEGQKGKLRPLNPPAEG